MYPEDEDEQANQAETSQPEWVPVLGAVLIGWLIAGGVALLANLIVASFITPAGLGGVGSLVLYLAGPAGAIAGGYVAVGITHQHGRWLGVLVGVLVLPVLVLTATHWVEVSLVFLASLGAITAGLLTIFSGWLGGWVNNKFFLDTGWKEKWKVRGWEDLLYQDLLRKVRFNGSTADRLIEYERRQDPQASRLQLIQSAIERWERDNR